MYLWETVTVTNGAKLSWEKDLGVIFTVEHWEEVVLFNQTLENTSVSLQENRFKMLNRWYLIPQRLAKMYPHLDSMGWRC